MKKLVLSFNPYFNGYSTLTLLVKVLKSALDLGFNPYFNGYSTLTEGMKANNITFKF